MTPDELHAAVRRLDLSRFPIPVRIVPTVNEDGTVSIDYVWTTRCRDTGAPYTQHLMVHCVENVEDVPVEQVPHFLFGHLLSGLEHELREAFLYDGTRLFEPHGAGEIEPDTGVVGPFRVTWNADGDDGWAP